MYLQCQHKHKRTHTISRPGVAHNDADSLNYSSHSGLSVHTCQHRLVTAAVLHLSMQCSLLTSTSNTFITASADSSQCAPSPLNMGCAAETAAQVLVLHPQSAGQIHNEAYRSSRSWLKRWLLGLVG